MLQVILIGTVLLSASAAATPLAPGNAVIQQTDEVHCHSDDKCEVVGEKMTMRECCLKDNMLSYSTSEGCNQCILYGWLKEDYTMVERVYPYELEVGYLKGSGPDMTFRVTVEQCTTTHKVDYTVSPQQLTIKAKTVPSIVEVDTYVDGVALEPDEHFLLKLEVEGSPAPGFFQDTINITIKDSDELMISLTSSEYRASEEEQTMVVVVKKDKQIASPLSLTITPATVTQAETWSDVELPQIPADNNPFSPNRATTIDDPPKSNKDFDDNPIHAEFLPDEYSPVNDLRVHVPIIDDDINEAPEEYFIIKLDSASSNKLVKVVEPRASLGKIVDDDPIRIGFNQSSYTISLPEYYHTYDIDMITSEDDRISQQTFVMILQSVAGSPRADLGVVSNRMIHSVFATGSRIVVHDFDSYEKTKKFELHIIPYYLPKEPSSYPVAFEVVISGAEHEPYFLQASKLYQSLTVVITA